MRIRIRPVGVGDSTISRSAAVTSSSSGSFGALRGRHQIEFDDAPAGRAVVDRVIGDAGARVERHRRIGLAHRHAQLERPGAQDRSGTPRVAKAGSMNGSTASSGVGAGSGTMLFAGAVAERRV